MVAAAAGHDGGDLKTGAPHKFANALLGELVGVVLHVQRAAAEGHTGRLHARQLAGGCLKLGRAYRAVEVAEHDHLVLCLGCHCQHSFGFGFNLMMACARAAKP